MKKFVALLILTALVLGGVPAFAATEKDGYALTPTSTGTSGVDVASTFQLTTPEDCEQEDIGARLTLDGQSVPTVEKTGERTFLITPASQLSANTLYTFRLARPDAAELTWVFQTAKKFAVTSVFPGNQATNVPINSGIEITFSTEGYGEIDSYFSISPAVKGTFEYHKNTAVFVPEALEYETVYTVSLQGGIARDGTEETITEDTVFSFETQAKKEKEAVQTWQTLGFSTAYADCSTTQPPSLYLYAYDSEKSKIDVKINVYQLKNTEQGVEAAMRRSSVPYWCNYADGGYTSVSGLSRVASFQASLSKSDGMLTLPSTLSEGFYVVEAKYNDAYDQMILQISDLPVQVIADTDRAIVWVNDISTGTAAAGATVYDAYDKATYKTDEHGVAVINRALCATAGVEQLRVTAKDGRTCTWFYNSRTGISSTADSDDYWNYLQLDRSLFQRDDDVLFWGFAQSRAAEEPVQSVRAVLTQGYYIYSRSDRDILQSQTVPVTEGTYSGALSLPNLDAGTYCLSIYHGDILLTSTYFSVEDYEKPAYKLEITTEKKAVFADETVPFHISTAFFEGTPVPGLELSYRFHGYQSRSGTAATDADGTAVVTEVLAPNSSQSTILSFSAEATLPEIGDISDSASVRVFVNDIDLKAQAKRTEGNATLTVDVNSITLDRLNNGTATGYSDYLDAPVPGKEVSVQIYRVYYTKEADGSYYDYIEKKSMQTYKYVRHEETLDQFTLETDAGGKAQKHFTVPNVKGETYYAAVTCQDNNGRTVSSTVYIGRDYSSYYNSLSSQEYALQTEKTKYDLGEEVQLTLQRGEDVVPGRNVLFVQMQNGIGAYQAGENPYTFSFADQHIPNIYVYAYCFDGLQYQNTYRMYKNLTFQSESKALNLTITPDQDAYAPGDACTVRIAVTDANGVPKQANVNLSVVDEALFTLQDYSVDPLQTLYSTVQAGISFTYATHAYIQLYGYLTSGSGGTSMAESADADTGGSSNQANLRETFLDTAFFDTIQTDAHGQAAYTFVLPDNITSWRLTAAGISKDLYAGSATGNVAVTQPVFLNYTLSDTFLAGDTPTVGITAYGTGLTGNEPVTFTVWDEASPDQKYTAQGTALTRMNIPLWEMTDEGAHALIMQAEVNGGQSDMVKHTYDVLSSYRQVTTAQYYDLTADTVLQTGTSGLTNITFTDRSRGQYLSELLRMQWGSGDRVERMLVRRESAALIAAYFPDLTTWTLREDAFDPMQYQRSDGGMAILPYAESDVVTTVKLMPYVLDEVNKNALKNYLYDIYEGDGGQQKTCALYGLAQLKEPVLLELDSYAQLEELSVLDTVYVALGYCALGETASANALYSARIAPSLEQIAPYYRVNTGADNDDILEATSAAVLLAATLNQPEWEGLYQYCVRNQTVDILITLEKFRYIEMQMEQTTAEGGSITYSLYGETYTRDLTGGRSYTLRIPAQNMSAFALQSVEGAVGAVSSYEIPMTDGTSAETGISVTRKYYNANGGALENNSMKQGDLVRVELTVTYAPQTVQGSYSVTDYLPAGLAYVSSSAKIEHVNRFGYGYSSYAATEGKKVIFYDYNRPDSTRSVYYYYARVICPGTFQAEGTVVQNLAATGYMTLGADDTISIS